MAIHSSSERASESQPVFGTVEDSPERKPLSTEADGSIRSTVGESEDKPNIPQLHHSFCLVFFPGEEPLLSYLKDQLKVSPLCLDTVSASGEDFESHTAEVVGLVAKVLFKIFWGFWTGKSLLQQSPAAQGLGVGAELIMGLLRDKEDSASVCSKKTYFTARSSARPRVITCSRSILADTKSYIQGLLHQSQ